jgi:hypothetical protein
MQWRKWNQAPQFGDHRRVDADRRRIAGSAMDDAMADADEAVRLKLLREPSQQDVERFLMRCRGGELSIDEPGAGAVHCKKMTSLADVFYFAFAEAVALTRFRRRWKERKFNARGAGVDRENGVAHGFFPAA